MKIKNKKQIEAASKNDAGGDEKHIYFFTSPKECTFFIFASCVVSR